MGEFNGVPLSDPEKANSNVIFVPENTPHSYDENGNAIFYAWPAGIGDPPVENQAPGAKAAVPIVWGEPKVVFGTDPARPQLGNTVAQAPGGYAPGNIWYNTGDVSGSPSGGGPAKTAAIAALATLTTFLTKAK